jgi:hypothetical protein
MSLKTGMAQISLTATDTSQAIIIMHSGCRSFLHYVQDHRVKLNS